MRARHAVLLTPSECAVPRCLPSCKQIAPITPLGSALTSRSQRTENAAILSLAESALTSIPPASSLESALTKTPGEGGLLLVPVLATLHSPQYLSSFFSHSCALFCAFLHLSKTQLLCFQSFPHSLRKNTGGGVSSFRDHLAPVFCERRGAIRARPAGSGEEPLPSLSLPPYFLTSLLPYLSPVQSLRFQLRYK